LGINVTDLKVIVKKLSGYDLIDVIYTNERSVLKQKDRVYMGFVAYNKEKRDLAFIFRGTKSSIEWVGNAKGFPAPWRDPSVIDPVRAALGTFSSLFIRRESDPIFVHRGFKAFYTREEKKNSKKNPKKISKNSKNEKTEKTEKNIQNIQNQDNECDDYKESKDDTDSAREIVRNIFNQFNPDQVGSSSLFYYFII
jgi:hypothetical protein